MLQSFARELRRKASENTCTNFGLKCPAQLSSQLGAIFYQAGVWEWNEEKRGMEFILLSDNWQEKTIEYYRDSLNSGSEAAFLDNFLEPGEKEKPGRQQQQNQEGQIETAREIEQMKLSAFFRD